MNTTFLNHHKAIIAGSVVVAGIAVGVVFLQKPESAKPAGGVYVVAPSDITEQVDAGGAVAPARSVDLAFDRGGRVARVNVAVGDSVYAGETLVALDAGDLAASRAQAAAAVDAARANLEQLKQGAKPEQVAVYQTALEGAEGNAVAAISAAYAAADDAVRNKTDALFSNPRSPSPSLNLTISDSQLKINLESGRITVEKELNGWAGAADSLSSSGDVKAALSDSEQKIDAVRAFVDMASQALAIAAPTSSVPQATINSYAANISAARAAISAASQSLAAASAAVKTAEKNLTLAESSATADQIAAGEAAVSEAKANVSNIDAQIGKTVMNAPFGGVITAVEAKVGEVAAPAMPLVSVISNSRFQMEVYVSQVDIGKVKAGDSASVGLDAYPGAVFPAHVITVDPAPVPPPAAAAGGGTISGPNAAYKVTLQFDNDDKRVKSGLSGNVLIITEAKTGVLAVPTDSIILRGTDTYVLVSTAGTSPILSKVTAGISGQGFTEIIAGLAAGERIVSFTDATSAK